MRSLPQGLEWVRFTLILSAFSPVFILWALRGPDGIPEGWLWFGAAVLAIGPNWFLHWRAKVAMRDGDSRMLTVTKAVDSSENLLIYLFAVLLPLYDANMDCWRDQVALGCAFLFVIFIFWHLDLIYLNLMFAMLGYRLYALDDHNTTVHGRRLIVLSKRPSLPQGTELFVYRISATIHIETTLP